MVYDIFYVSKNNIGEQDWKQFRSRFPSAQKIDNVTSFDDIKKKAFTKFFWVVWNDLTLTDLSIFEFKVSKFEEEFIHVFKNRCNSIESYFGGVVLFPKNCKVSSKEFQHRFFLNKKEHDIVASEYRYPVLKLTTYDEYTKFATTNPHPLFWGVWSDIEIVNTDIFDLYFDPNNGEYDYDRSENHMYKNSCNRVESYLSGVVLFSTNKIISEREFNRRFLVDKKEHDLVVSKYRYPQYVINSYQEYLDILENETQKMFWCIWPDIEIVNNDIFDFYFDPNDGKYDYDRSENHMYKNSCNGVESYLSGVVLFSTDKVISEREFNRRFLVDKKEHDLVISKYRYPRYNINNYQEYLDILENETQKMFWCIWPDIEITNSEIFDFYFDPNDGKYDYDRSINHMFKNKVIDEEFFVSGLALCSTEQVVSKKEFEHRFFIDKKEHDVIVSKSKPYDKFVIEKFEDYKYALENSSTDMFWTIPSEVEPLEDFKFDLQFPYQNNYERSINHVFKNKDVEEIKYNGIMLLSKQAPISAREVEYRYLI